MALTFISIYDRKNNAFDDLRFILASLVLFYHSYELVNNPTHDSITKLMAGQSSLGEIAVYAFFVLSGFFMIQSLENAKSLFHYFRNRIYRIIPAFWFSLVLFSFIIIPFYSSIKLTGGVGSALDFVLKAGSCFYLYRDRILLSQTEKMNYSWLIFLSAILIVCFMSGTGRIALLLWIPYFFILLGCLFRIKFFSKFGDYSYGMYIYAFPIQQLIIYFIPEIGPVDLFILSFGLTLCLSIFSYHFIERPILKLKR